MLVALLLGLLTAISPCPLATNIAAVSYIGKDVADRRRVFAKGLMYTLGRTVSYTVLGVAWLIAFSIGKVGSFYGKMKTVQKWVSWIAGGIFISAGVYYCITLLF